MEYYALWHRLECHDSYLIWATDLEGDAKDTVLLDREDCLLTFDNLHSLTEYAATIGLSVTADEPKLFDLDWAANWVRDLSATTVDCANALSAWNLFLDVCQSVKHDRKFFLDNAEPNRILYDKLFFGNNHPAITPEGETYMPSWSQHEISAIRTVLSAGLKMFQSNLPSRGA